MGLLSFHYLGDVSRCTFVTKSGKIRKEVSMPGVDVIDLFLLQNKKNKKLHTGLPVQWYLEEKILNRKNKKFNEALLKKMKKDLSNYSAADQMMTVIEMVAREISNLYKNQKKPQVDMIFLHGRGLDYRILKKRIQYHLPLIEVFAVEELSDLTRH